MGGYVMQLQNFSVNDGEGIRTNIFLAGCPLKCKWCANPEGQTLKNAMTTYMTTEEILTHIKKQMIFYRKSGGGVTFSGGEATAQTEFLRELVGELYDMGISLAIETCGYFKFDDVVDVLNKMDLIFVDIKHMDEQKHIDFTGETNERILENIKKMSKLHIPIVIRIPAICGVNTDEKNLTETFLFIKNEVPGAKLEFLPYHTFGEGKYAKLGLTPPPEEYKRPDDVELKQWEEMARSIGIEVVSYK